MVETRTRERAAHPPSEPSHRRQALTITLALLTLSRLQGAVAPTAIFTELFKTPGPFGNKPTESTDLSSADPSATPTTPPAPTRTIVGELQCNQEMGL